MHELESIGRYTVVRLLGRGGMGSVYLARDPLIDRDIAVKLLDAALDPVARARFAREARAAGRLHHPNIVTVFDVGEHEGRPYIAMEYVPGPTLAKLIAKGPPKLTEGLRLIADACAGLAYAHRAGVVHLDVKPANLVRHENGTLKVLDFGIARLVAPDETHTINLLGTPRYMAPEQLSGEPVDRRSDVFALGCVLFETLTGKPLFPGGFTEMLARTEKPISVPTVEGVPPDVMRMIRRATASVPAERYEDLDELRGELEAVRHRLSGSASTVKPIAGPAPDVPRRSRMAAAAASGILALAAILWLWRVDTSEPPRPEPEPLAESASVVEPTPSQPSLGAPAPAAPAPAPASSPATTAASPSPAAPRSAPLPDVAQAEVPRGLPPATHPVQDQVVPPPVAPPSPTPLAAREPPAVAPAPVSAPPAVVARPAEDSIRAVLAAYEAAYDGRDVAALRRIVPTLSAEQLEAVGRTFSGAASYDLTLQVLATNVTGATAVARCLVTHAFVPRVGSPPRSGPVETRFHLRQVGSDWVIDRIETLARR